MSWLIPDKKYHCYLAVLEGDEGYKEQLTFFSNNRDDFTYKDVKDIKSFLGDPRCKVLSSLIYLGYMSKDRFNNSK